jgi:hypothetical protein
MKPEDRTHLGYKLLHAVMCVRPLSDVRTGRMRSCVARIDCQSHQRSSRLSSGSRLGTGPDDSEAFAGGAESTMYHFWQRSRAEADCQAEPWRRCVRMTSRMSATGACDCSLHPNQEQDDHHHVKAYGLNAAEKGTEHENLSEPTLPRPG